MGRHSLSEGSDELGGVSRILTEAEVDDMEFAQKTTVLTVEQVEVSRLYLLGRGVMDATVELP